jgi:colanic acid biosynthesis glycosyl transferase WcaI
MGFAQDLTSVVAAAQRLRDRHDIVFFLVGDGVYADRWKQMARDLPNVRFLPMQAKSEYFQILQASDVCLAPLSLTLNSPAIPGKIQSIMAVARPVMAIVNSSGDAADLIARSRSGVTVPPDRPEEVAARILQLSDDPEMGEKLGASGRAYAEQNFSRRRAVADWEDVLKATVASARQGR